MEFILCKPMANEALRDYIARLKPIAKMANMDNDDSYLQRIIQYYPDEQVRTKAIEANMTIENLIAWQSTRERCESLLASTATSSVNRIENRRPNNNYSNNYNYKGNDNNRFSNQSWAQASSRRSDSQASNYMCVNCGFKGIHNRDGCPAANKECYLILECLSILDEWKNNLGTDQEETLKTLYNEAKRRSAPERS
jgi:hypothetical protein